MDLLIYSFLILICNFDLATTQEEFSGPFCGLSGNYTQNTDYRHNLDDVLYTLINTNNGFGFYNSTSGQANAAALCRGDIQPENCRRCVDDATRRIRQQCPVQIEAVGWYETCFIRYSNRSMGSINDLVVFYAWNARNVSDSSIVQWNKGVADLLSALLPEAAGGGQFRKYSSLNITPPGFWTIYGMMQCTPELSEMECSDCLYGAVSLVQPLNRSLGNTNIGIIVGPILAVVFAMIMVVVFFTFRRRRLKRNLLSSSSILEREDEDNGEMNSFNLSTIQVSTNNFSQENKLGEGGFGPVYKGTLQDGKEIAVKRLARNSRQGLVEFKTEVNLIIKLQHKNLVRLLGYCVKGPERLLIYEFMANNSLDTFLFDANKCKELDWAKRSNIVIGIAKGLRYLHEDSRLKIIHRDMKASNILLDNEMNAKISDFGTARIFGGNQMEAATDRIVGTYGYMAPEYAMEGLFSTKSDVYSFGVLLLEIVSGQRNNLYFYQDQPQNLLLMAWRLWNENKGEQIVDHRLIQTSAIDEALRWINIALLCVQEDPQDRPTMSTII
uniref:non-specific serine/threonine protein kinase n=1 Tax=Helianthus annuus TaxID=4232 RepID=A0A251ULH0_HELAN